MSIRGLIFGATLLAAGCNTTADSAQPFAVSPSHVQTQVDPPSTHGMLVLGDGPVYLSHLPMFHKPHDYQVLFEVEMTKAGVDAVSAYTTDRRTTGEDIYTIVPERLSLPELFGANGGTPQRTTFQADLFRGHFERGGTEILKGVTMHIKRVIHEHKFVPGAEKPQRLRYLAFGNEHQLFAAHIITAKPDFDHLVSISIRQGVLTEAQAAAIYAGAVLEFDAPDDVQAALAEGEAKAATVEIGGQTLPVTVNTQKSFYLETGDLAE